MSFAASWLLAHNQDTIQKSTSPSNAAHQYLSALREALVSDQLGERLAINLHGSSRSCPDNADMKMSMTRARHIFSLMEAFPATLVNLPTISEIHKAIDIDIDSKFNFCKCGDLLSDDSSQGARQLRAKCPQSV